MEQPLLVSSYNGLVGKFVLLFCGLHVASILVAPRLFATHYRPLSPSEQRDWHGRVVGSLFATGIVFVALPEYLWPGDALAADEAFGTSDRASLTCAIAAAFFVWDVFFCTAACQGWPFVLHASAGLFIYWHALQPFQQRAACFFLCWEASTPLLNLRSQLIACRLTHTRTFSCANVGFAAAFLIIRCVPRHSVPKSRFSHKASATQVGLWHAGVGVLVERLHRPPPRRRPSVATARCLCHYGRQPRSQLAQRVVGQQGSPTAPLLGAALHVQTSRPDACRCLLVSPG